MKILLFIYLASCFCNALAFVPNRDKNGAMLNDDRSPRHGLDTSEEVPKLDVLNAEDQQDQMRIKRKTKKGNLDNLYPTLAIRSVNVNMDWFGFAKDSNVTQIASAFVLSDGKSLVAHIMNMGTLNNYYTIPALEQDRVYRGEIKILTDREEVKNFIRKQSNRKHAEEFELTTPFVVPGKLESFYWAIAGPPPLLSILHCLLAQNRMSYHLESPFNNKSLFKN